MKHSTIVKIMELIVFKGKRDREIANRFLSILFANIKSRIIIVLDQSSFINKLLKKIARWRRD